MRRSEDRGFSMKKSARKVAITGLGAISSIGLSVDELLKSLADSRSGIQALKMDGLNKTFPAGIVQQSFEKKFTKLDLPFLDRCQQLAILAAKEAVLCSGIEDFSAFGPRAGVYYGNVNGGAATGIAWSKQLLVDGKQTARPFTAMAIMGNAGAAQVAIRNRVYGPVITNATACGSSGIAIGDAARAISDGYIDVAIAGGSEAPLSSGIMSVFDGTRALSKPDPTDISRSCKPFSTERSGLVLGEGAAFVILEDAEIAMKRGAKIYGLITGYGVSCDATHIGMPDKKGQMACLESALISASMNPSDIQYINAHATATNGGDIIEAEAIRSIFGCEIDSAAVSSTKSAHGHLLGAASALEFIVTTLAVHSSIMPATMHAENSIDQRCKLNHVGVTPRDEKITNALSFSCGFGGTNVALIVSAPNHLLRKN
jgi:3-oxoacyl-[acyl-carrier-protein] synthase II